MSIYAHFASTAAVWRAKLALELLRSVLAPSRYSPARAGENFRRSAD